jgi:tetratricopeptide (TPR) repeat protein
VEMGRMVHSSEGYRLRRSGILGLQVAFVLLLGLLSLLLAGCSDRAGEARQLENAGDWPGALALYNEVLAEDPDDQTALSGAAVALLVLQRYDEALGFQERLVAADPGDVQIRVELGFNLLNHQARPADAVVVLREAVALEPSAKNLTFLAQALEQSGDQGEAEAALRKAIVADAAYGYSYTQLVRLLEEEGRLEDAAEVKDQAAAMGI